MPEPTLADVLESVRVLLEARTVPCHHDKEQAWDIPGVASRCVDCHGTYEMLNPDYEPLLAVVRGSCPGCMGPCDTCPTDGYITRTDYWTAAPNGALEGALLKALAFRSTYQLELDLIHLLRQKRDTRMDALLAVKTWLEGHTMPEDQKLGTIPPGTLFETRGGVRAVKSEYRYSNRGQCLCVLLESGEYAHFPNGDDELVRVLSGSVEVMPDA